MAELHYQTDWLHRTFHAYESKLVHYAWSIVGDMESARDITQDTFLKLCRESPESVGDPPNAWLYKICRNRAIDHYRTTKRRPTVSVEDAHDQLLDHRDASDGLVREEKLDNILSALANLPEREQEIVRLKFLHDFSYKQIAETVGLSVGNVGYILHGALVKLRDQVANDENNSPPRRGERRDILLAKETTNTKQPPNKNLRALCVSAVKIFFFFRPATLTGASL
jgi:RNA polymerase sigma-70 factor (ECF subfamily)